MQRKEPTKLKPGEPTKPAGLSKQASLEWDRLVQEMRKSGITLSPAYRSLLSVASTLSADIHDAWETLEAEGRYITNARTGAVKEHPAGQVLSTSRARLLFALVQLGLTPKAQQADKDEPEQDEMAKILGPRRRIA